MTLDIENTDFCAYNSTLPTTDVAIAETFEEAFHLLGPDHSFAFFDLGLTAAEKELLNQLGANSTKDYENAFNPKLHDSYINYLENIGNDKKLSSSTVSILEGIIQHSQSLFPMPKTVMAIQSRALDSLKPDLNWHIDRDDYEVTSDVSYRITISLKGPGTMFCQFAQEQERVETLNAMNTVAELRSIINPDAYSKAFNLDVYLNAMRNITSISSHVLYKSLNPCLIENGATTHQTPLYFGSVFMYGKTDNPAIHTIPPIDDMRIVFILDLN